MFRVSVALLCTVTLAASAAELSEEDLVCRVNCGAPVDSTDAYGRVWLADREWTRGSDFGAVGGDTVVRGFALSVPSTEPLVYRCERYNPDKYLFSVSNGTYVVRLHFAETYTGNLTARQRVFMVVIQGTLFRSDIDPLRDAGGFARPQVETIGGIDVTDNLLEVAFRPRVNGAMINGIEVYRQRSADAIPQLDDPARPTARVSDDYTLEWPVEPDEDDAFHLALFRCWVPGGIKRLYGAVVFTPGLNSDGRMWADVPEWQALARSNRCALIGSWLATRWGFNGFPEESPGYMDAGQSGSGEALLKALNALAEHTGHPELTSVPLALWGHSAGGVFNLHFATWQPERVIAFVVNKFARMPDALPPATCAVPALLVAGESDRLSRRVDNLFRAGRTNGALWCLAEERRSGHGINASLGLTRAFFEQAIPLRVQGCGKELRPMDPTNMWLGELGTFAIRPSTNATVNTDTNTVYLVNEAFAEQWREFVTDPRDPFGLDTRE
jgi:hypothetical protein